jgi:hypothetical protein
MFNIKIAEENYPQKKRRKYLEILNYKLHKNNHHKKTREKKKKKTFEMFNITITEENHPQANFYLFINLKLKIKN